MPPWLYGPTTLGSSSADAWRHFLRCACQGRRSNLHFRHCCGVGGALRGSTVGAALKASAHVCCPLPWPMTRFPIAICSQSYGIGALWRCCAQSAGQRGRMHRTATFCGPPLPLDTATPAPAPVASAPPPQLPHWPALFPAHNCARCRVLCAVSSPSRCTTATTLPYTKNPSAAVADPNQAHPSPAFSAFRSPNASLRYPPPLAGANDVANAFGSSVAARTLTMKQALLIATVCEFSGSVLLGEQVGGQLTAWDMLLAPCDWPGEQSTSRARRR